MNFTPTFKLLANNKDITNHIAKNLISLQFKDEAGEKSDEITLSVYGDFKRPSYKDILKLYLGYKEGGLFFCGSFYVQTTERAGEILTITATGADFSSGLKVKKNRTFEKMSLKEVVEKIAKEHNLESRCDYEDVFYSYLPKNNENDTNLLSSFASSFGEFFNIKNNEIIFLKKGESEKLPQVSIDAKECSSLRIKYSNKTQYLSAKALWQDSKENKVKEVIVGSGDPQLILQQSFLSASEATLKAEAKLKASNAGIVSGSLEIYGSKIYAGGKLKLWTTKEEDGEYNIKSVSHSFSSRGWRTRVEFEN